MSLMIGGALLLPFQMLIYPKFADRCGPLFVMKSCGWALNVLYVGFPFLAYLKTTGDFYIWLGISIAQLVKIVCYASIFTSVLMLYCGVCLGPHLG